MTKLIDLPLVQLYQRPSITASVEEAIRSKEDFSQIQPSYCQAVCKLKCKQFDNAEGVRLLDHHPDILILQDHNALPDTRYNKSSHQIEEANLKILRALIKQCFPDGTTYYVSNLLKCGVTAADMVKGKGPGTTVLSKCAPYLLSEIERCAPTIIISLTTSCTKALGFTKKSNTNNRGEIHRLADGTPVIFTLHPKLTTMIRQNASGAMWGPDYWEVIKRDFVKASKLLSGELDPGTLDDGIAQAQTKIQITNTLQGVKTAVERILSLGKTKIVSFDTETTGLDPWAPEAKLLTIQFGYKNEQGEYEAVVIPLWHRENKAYRPEEAWALLLPILERSDVPKIGHNAKFDILYIYATTGCRVQGLVYDTMLVLHNLNSGIQGCYGLKAAVWDWIPESNLGGYEDKLPSLTKTKKEVKEEEQGEMSDD